MQKLELMERYLQQGESQVIISSLSGNGLLPERKSRFVFVAGVALKEYVLRV